MEDFKIIQLHPECWKEYRDLRLEALQSDPEAFGQKYDKALDFPDKYWIDHLKRTLKKDKLIVYFAENRGKLIGMMGAFFHYDKETKDSARIFSVYVDRRYRGLGVAKKLQAHLLEELRHVKKLKKIRVMVNKKQISASNLYKQGNFKIIKTEKEILGDGKEYEVDTMEQSLN